VNRIDRRKSEMRNRILRAALDLFRSQGVVTTTLEDICEHADVASRTFYNYFPARQALLVALAHRWLDTLSDSQVVRTADPMPTRLVTIFDAIATALTQSTEADREMIGELMTAVGRGTHRGLALHEAFIEMAKQGIESGHVNSRHDPEILADLVISVLSGQIGNWTADPAFPLASDLHNTAHALADLLKPNVDRPRQ
jgi:AcrR family transcriptional regulator